MAVAVDTRATDAQINYLADLATKRQVSDVQAGWAASVKAGDIRITKEQATRAIAALLKIDLKPREAQAGIGVPEDAPKVDDGRYAIELDGVLKFFILRSGKAGGRWEGVQFIDAQGGPNIYPVRDRAYKHQILNAIAANALVALARYGQELGHCGRCGLELTDETSRALGIGPICRGKLGL